MKLAVCGKGGSGKSIVTALLARNLVKKGKQVLVVDSDESNSSLYRILGFANAPVPLMELVGGKNNVKDKLRSASQGGVNIMQQESLNIQEIPENHIQGENGLNLVSVGKIHQSMEGCACPMGVLSREFLKKISLQENQELIVDMEAGIEHFGRGLESSLDSVLTVVEPSRESLNLAGKMQELCNQAGINSFGALINKAPSKDLSRQLEEELENQSIRVLGSIFQEQEIFRAGLSGEPIDSEIASDRVQEVLEKLF